jgi:hypothetical protein
MKFVWNKWFWLALIFMSLFVGFLFGFGVYHNSDFHYKDASIMTCEYANKLTDIINNQSRSIELYAGHQMETFERLDKLNCSLLKGG